MARNGHRQNTYWIALPTKYYQDSNVIDAKENGVIGNGGGWERIVTTWWFFSYFYTIHTRKNVNDDNVFTYF